MELYIGLMSGTSADGIDAALVDFSSTHPQVLATHYTPYSQTLREKILFLYQKGDNEIERLGELDRLLGLAFAEATQQLLKQQSLPSTAIKAIGSHGQKKTHHPPNPPPFPPQKRGTQKNFLGKPGFVTIIFGLAFFCW